MVQLCNVGVSGDGLRLFPLNIAVFTQVLRIFDISNTPQRCRDRERQTL